MKNFYFFIFVNQENHIPLSEIIKISKPPEMTTRKNSQKLHAKLSKFSKYKKQWELLDIMNYFSYVQIFTKFLIHYYSFSFFYIDAVIFYNLFFQQNQTMKIKLYQTNPYSIIQFYKNKRQLTRKNMFFVQNFNHFFVFCN